LAHNDSRTFFGWKRRVDSDASFNYVEIAPRPLISLQMSPSHLSAEPHGIRDVTSAAMCCDSSYFFALCQTAGISGVLDSLAAANHFSMSPQFWSGQTTQPSPSSLHRVAAAVRIAGIIRPLILHYSRTARFSADLLFVLLSSSADSCLVHWALCGLVDMNALNIGVWNSVAYLPMPKVEPQLQSSLVKRMFSRGTRVAPAIETGRGRENVLSAVLMKYVDATTRFQVPNRSVLSPTITW
jgi:hypothetical protein